MTVKITLKGFDKFKTNMTRLAQLNGFEVELDSSAQMISTAAAENLDQMVSENASGKLASSLYVTSGEQEFSRRIGTELKYAAFVEFGTLHTPPRPWLAPALEMHKDTILKRFSQVLLRNVIAPNSLREE